MMFVCFGRQKPLFRSQQWRMFFGFDIESCWKSSSRYFALNKEITILQVVRAHSSVFPRVPPVHHRGTPQSHSAGLASVASPRVPSHSRRHGMPSGKRRMSLAFDNEVSVWWPARALQNDKLLAFRWRRQYQKDFCQIGVDDLSCRRRRDGYKVWCLSTYAASIHPIFIHQSIFCGSSLDLFTSRAFSLGTSYSRNHDRSKKGKILQIRTESNAHAPRRGHRENSLFHSGVPKKRRRTAL